MSSSRLADRIREEYLLLPGLNLTFWQVQRLFTADEASCRAALDALVTEGFLQQTPTRTFSLSWRAQRRTCASHASPAPGGLAARI